MDLKAPPIQFFDFFGGCQIIFFIKPGNMVAQRSRQALMKALLRVFASGAAAQPRRPRDLLHRQGHHRPQSVRLHLRQGRQPPLCGHQDLAVGQYLDIFMPFSKVRLECTQGGGGSVFSTPADLLTFRQGGLSHQTPVSCCAVYPAAVYAGGAFALDPAADGLAFFGPLVCLHPAGSPAAAVSIPPC